MNPHVQRLAEWLTEQGQPRKLRGANRKSAEFDCTQIDLVHCHVDGGMTPIMQLDLGKDIPGQAINIAEKIVTAAESHAHAFNLVQLYVCHLLWDGEKGAEYPMRFGGEVLRGESQATEPANAAGIISQQMRHTEAQARTNALLTSTIIQQMNRENQRKDERIATLEQERIQFLELMETLATKSHEREMAMLRETRKQNRIDSGVKYLQLLAPAAINGLCQKFGIPMLTSGGGISTPSAMAVKAWLKSLTEAQIMNILAHSAPEQQVALMTAYKELALKDESGFSDLAKPTESH